MIGALLEAGVAPEDLSVVIRNSGHFSFGESQMGLKMVDSGEAGTALYGHPNLEKEGSFYYESQFGGGISTSTPDDDVSKVEEMDESQEESEDLSYPAGERSYSWQEESDVERAAQTGYFNTTDPGAGGLNGRKPLENLPGMSELSAITIPGMGLVIGDGALATVVVGAGVASEAGGAPPAGIHDYLEDQGVPNDIAWLLARDFELGGAVLAVASPPGAVDSDILQTVLESNGANNVQLIDAVD